MLGETRTDTLTVYLTIDVGPADAVLGKGRDIDADWTATMRGTALLFDAFARIGDRLGAPVESTWFLRADRLIEAQFGDRLAVIEQFEALVAPRGVPPFEAGWMPQIYGSDLAAIDHEDLSATHARLVTAGHVPFSVRMGNCYHDDRSMAALAALGVALDSSALPGRMKIEGGWKLDWSTTPDRAYRPSRADYRRPGQPALAIVEVPLTMLPIKADYDAAPLARYVNPAMWPELIWPGLGEAVAARDYLVLIVHPDEVYPERRAAGHPLITYSVRSLTDNLMRLLAEAQRIGRGVRFAPLRDFPLDGEGAAAAD